MRRSIASAIAMALSLAVTPVMAANAAPSTCGTLCSQMQLGDAGQGAWFLDGKDELLLAGYDGFRVISTYSQKTTFRYTVPDGDSIDTIARSQNSNWVVVALESGVVYRYDTDDWSRSAINGGAALSDVSRVAVSNNGVDVFVASNSNVGSIASTISRYRNGDFAENVTTVGDDFGVYALALDYLDANLYVGWNGNSPTFAKFDAADISAGIVASDNSSEAWSASRIVVASDGTVFGGNTDYASEGDPGATYPFLLKLNGSTMAVTDTIDTIDAWRGWELDLSDDESTLYVATYYDNATPGDSAEANKIDLVNPSTLNVTDTFVFDDLSDAWIQNIDVDSNERFLVASISGSAILVSLNDSPITLSAEIFVMNDTTSVIDWQYSYFNPKAKFKWFEVKYYPVGKRKAVVKRVKRATSLEIGQVKPDTDVRVRAVYTKKRYNTAWDIAQIAVP